MITIGIENIYCCKDSEYIKYTIEVDLDIEVLTKLKKYHNEHIDLYHDNPFDFLKSYDVIDCHEYFDCDYMLCCIMC